jgi:hypothetical protein
MPHRVYHLRSQNNRRRPILGERFRELGRGFWAAHNNFPTSHQPSRNGPL